jgi:histidine ammonia-lyase
VSAAKAAQRRAAVRTDSFSLTTLRTAYSEPVTVTLSRAQMARVRRSAATVDRMIARGGAVYGVNTGFGLLCNAIWCCRIPRGWVPACPMPS